MSLTRCPFLRTSPLPVPFKACPFLNPSRARFSTTAVRSVAESKAGAGQATGGEGGGEGGRGKLLRNAMAGFGVGLGVAMVLRSRDGLGAKNSVQCESAKPTPGLSSTTYLERTQEEGEVVRRKSAGGGDGDLWDPVRVKENEDDPQNPMRIRMSQFVMNLQDQIVTKLESLEATLPADPFSPHFSTPSSAPTTFHRDHWLRPLGGEGSSCTISGGRIFEKGGVNVSVVHGRLPPAAVKQMRADHGSLKWDGQETLPFFAAGLSIVLHPWNPHVPTIHMNVRYFEVDPPASAPSSSVAGVGGVGTNTNPEPIAWWFGGGTDLTPNYLYPEDAKHFHQTLKDAVDGHDTRYFPAWKKWCDKYFYNSHRGESRGIGGIFFDDLTSSSVIHVPGGGKDEPGVGELFGVVKSIGESFLPSYLPILEKRYTEKATEEERRWQLIRRGRYVEFNLLHDRGTKFGLMTPGARIESILISMPETARWEYMSPLGAKGSGTREEVMVEVLKNPVEWV